MSGVVGDAVEMGKVESNYMDADELRDRMKAETEYEQCADPLDVAARAANTAAIDTAAATVQAGADYDTNSIDSDAEVDEDLVANVYGLVDQVADPKLKADLQAALDDLNLNLTSDPPKKRCVKTRAFMAVLGFAGLGTGIAIGYAIWGAAYKAEQQGQTLNGESVDPVPPEAPPDFDKLMEKLVDDWNNIPDATFFTSFESFVDDMDGKSVQTVFYMASYALKLAKAKNNVEVSDKNRDSKILGLVSNWTANRSITQLISAAAAMTYTNSSGATVDMNRTDKLNILSLAMLRIISNANNTTPTTGGTTTT